MNTKNAKKKTETKERDFIKVDSYNVKNVRVVEGKKGDLVFLTLVLNGVEINGCRVATGKKGDFISFPQYKGSNGTYYYTAYASLSDDDTKAILEDVQHAIDEM